MLNEKYNNQPGWKSALDNLSSLPGEASTDVNFLWDKLDQRLRVKKETNRTIWYWAAAAFLIFFISIFFLININKQSVNNVATVSKKVNDQTERTVQQINTKNTAFIPVRTLPPSTKKTMRFLPVEKKMPVVIHQQENSNIDFLSEKNETKNDSAAQPVMISAFAKSAPVVFKSIKNKMPVVHINDLETPPTVSESVAGNNEKPSLRIRLFSKGNLNAPSPENSGANYLLKIKLSPQN